MNKTLKRICKITAISYVLAWIIGLSAGGPSLDLNAKGSSVVSAFTTHRTSAVVQYLFAEGVAGLLLLILVVTAFRGMKSQSSKPNTSLKVYGVSGVIASLISLTMATIALILITHTVSHGTAAQAKTLNDLVNRLDGPKMWLLGVMAVSGVRAYRELPRWLNVTGYALACSLVVSGIAYGFLIQSLAWAAYVAGILLLVWVCGFGVTLGSQKNKA